MEGSGICRSPVVAALVAGVALVGAGCGGGGEKTVVERTVTQQAPPASTPAASPSAAPSTSSRKVPRLVSLRLDEAESKLTDMHISYTELGGGVAGIVVKSNWTVCKTDPPAGKTTSGPVKLIVARSC